MRARWLALLAWLLLLPSVAGAQLQTIRAKQIIVTDGQNSVLQAPTMTTAQRNASTHVNGQIINCSDCSPAGGYMYMGGSWISLAGGGAGTITGTGTAGEAAFFTGPTSIGSSAAFTFDATASAEKFQVTAVDPLIVLNTTASGFLAIEFQESGTYKSSIFWDATTDKLVLGDVGNVVAIAAPIEARFELRFREMGGGTDYVGLIAPNAITTSRLIVLPAGTASPGQFVKSDGGSPTETWSYDTPAGTGLTGSGTAGQVASWSGSTALTGSATILAGQTVAPIGNPTIQTLSALAVQQTTSATDVRQFTGIFGLTSNQGASHTGANKDKVALYAGTDALAGTGDVWSLNTVLTQNASSGSYNAQGFELDFNNLNAHRGDTDAGGGLAAPVSYGLSITNASTFRSTAALLIAGSAGMWNRGIVIGNSSISSTGSSFQDLTSPHKSIDIRGLPTYGIFQDQLTPLNLLGGGAILGPVTAANLPAFGNLGRLFIVTDDNTLRLDTGAAWVPISGTGVGTVTHTAGPLEPSRLVVGNTAADIKVLASLGTTTTVLHGNAAGLPSFETIAIADLSATGTPSATTYLRGDNTWATPAGSGTVTESGPLTANEIILGAGTTVITPLGSLGTITTVLHGNAVGPPSFGAVALGTDVSGTLLAANFPALTGDVTSAGGTLTTVVANLPSGVVMAGSLLATAIAAPGTPAAGKGSIYVDSTSKNLAVKDDAGVVKHGVQTVACSAGDFVSGTTDAGGLTCGTPAGGGNVNAGATLPANELVIGAGSTSVARLGTLGTATTVLHGGAGAPVFAAVSLTADVSGLLPVASGGLGVGTLASRGVLYGNATSPVGVTAAAAADNSVLQVLVAGGVPAFTDGPTVTTLFTKGSFGLALQPWGAAPGNTGGVAFYELAANGSHFIGFKAADALAASVTLVWPDGYGAAGQALTTSGSGPLSWSTMVTPSSTLDANRLIVGAGTSVITKLGALGTTTTVLHGNAGGPPAFSQVVAADIGATGTPSASTYFRGDNTWATPTGAGTVTHTLGPLTANRIVITPPVEGAGDDITVVSTSGTSTCVWHGNATGPPTCGAVNLTTDVSGMSVGSIPFGISGGVLGQDNTAFFWDNTNKRLGIGTATPGAPVAIAHEASYTFPNPGPAAKGAINIRATTANRETGITFSQAGGDSAQAGIYVHQDNSAGTHMYLATTNSYATGPQVRMTILNTGNVGVGITDPLGKVHISGASVGNSNLRLTNTVALGRSWEINPYAVGVAEDRFAIRDATAGADRLNISAGGVITFGNLVGADSTSIQASTTGAITRVSASASTLRGRGSSGAGSIQEIALGAGLTMTGTTLSAGTAATGIAASTFPPPPTASGAWGPVRLSTNNIRGLWMDVPTAGWVPANRPCNVQMFGAKSDGTTNDDVAIRDAIAQCGTVFLPKNTLWMVAGNVLPSGAYTIEGEDPSVLVTCSTYAGAGETNCAGSVGHMVGPTCTAGAGATPCLFGGQNVSWGAGNRLINVSVRENFGIDGTQPGTRFIQFASNQSGGGVAGFHVAGIWDTQFGFAFGAANTGTPPGSDTPGLSIANSSGGDNIYLACHADKNVGAVNYGCRPINIEVFHFGAQTLSGGQTVLLGMGAGVGNYTGFDYRDNSGTSTNVGFHADLTAGSSGDFLQLKNAGAMKFLVDSQGNLGIRSATISNRQIAIASGSAVAGIQLTSAGGSGRSFALLSDTDGSMTLQEDGSAAVLMRFTSGNATILSSLKTTGAASGKKVVCVDTATGQLYASSTGVDCSN